MQRFVARQNIAHYRHLLETEQDPAKRAKLERLLSEANAQLDDAEAGATAKSGSDD